MTTEAEVIALLEQKMEEAKAQIVKELSVELELRTGLTDNKDYGYVHTDKFIIQGDLFEAWLYLQDKYEDPFASKAGRERT